MNLKAAREQLGVAELEQRIAALEAALADCSAALSQAIAAPLRTDVRMPADKNEWVAALMRGTRLLATRAGADAGEGRDA